MSLLRKEKEIKIDDKEYILAFDMTSIDMYKELSGHSFSLGTARLLSYDDKEIIYFLASALRDKKEPDKPLGEEVINGDVLYYLLNFPHEVVEIVASALPEPTNSKKK